MQQVDKLRQMLATGQIIMAPGAPDPLAARLAARAGFEAVYMTGFGATASRLGMPDIGLLGLSEMAAHARNMTRAVNVPVIADADTGYGGASNIARLVQEYSQAGVAALHLEDQIAPKRCGQMAGIKLISAEENLARLHGAVAARGSDGPLIIARTDALPAKGMAEALRRATLYQSAGVDLLFIDGIKTIAEVKAVAQGLPGPKVVSLVDGTEAAQLTAGQLQALGFNLVFYAVTALFTATKAVEQAFSALKSTGRPGTGPAQHSYKEFTEIVDLDFHIDLDDRFGGT